MNTRNALFIAAASLLFSISSSHAAIITDKVEVSASGFSSVPVGVTAPTDPALVTFTISFDPTKSYSDTYTGITLNSTNLGLSSAFGFNYDATTGQLNVGGASDGVDQVFLAPISDFYIQIGTFTTSPTFIQLGYVNGSNGNYFYTDKYSETSSVMVTTVSAVPLPASAPMFGAALLALGTAGYGVKRKSKAAA